MARFCHSLIVQVKQKSDITIALAGNPNVGKSVIFNQLTGLGVVTANYPGTTMELNVASTKFDGLTVGVIDLPGTYALGVISEDQWVARRCLLEGAPAVLVYIVDATNLERNLYMLLQLIDLKVPLVVALNLVDEAKRLGFSIDVEKLSRLLGVPVVPTVAIRGEGIKELLKQAVGVASGTLKEKPMRINYGRDVEKRISLLEKAIIKRLEEPPDGLPVRALSILLLEKDKEFTKTLEDVSGGAEVLKEAGKFASEIEAEHGEESSLRLSRERHGLAGMIAASVQTETTEKLPFSQRLWNYTIAPKTGIPLLIITLLAIFAFLFYVGSFLGDVLSGLWGITASPLIKGIIFAIFGQGALARTLLWGFDSGIEAALTIGVPYVLTFYFILAIMEDTGYLNSMAFLTDTIMHRVGLHGRAIIPMVAGAGCNVPAIIGTRVLPTMRERFIASTLIVLVPCSARIAVIMGGVSRFAGWGYALGIFGVTLLLIGAIGWTLNKMMPGKSSGLVMEMFPLRVPSAKATALKTWYRFKDFLFIALPVVMVGSLVLGALFETGLIKVLAAPLKPIIVDWLGLPLVSGVTLIFAVLRKELALQFLFTFAIAEYGPQARNLLFFMNKTQLFVYGLVTAIYIPCIATIGVLWRELGWKRATVIVVLTIVVAILLGGLAFRLLSLLGV